MSKVQPMRIDLVRDSFEGSALVTVSNVDPAKGENHALTWDLDLDIHIAAGTDPGLNGAKAARNDAQNGRGSSVVKHKPADGLIRLCLFTPEDDAIQAVEIDATLRHLHYNVTDKDEHLVARVRLPGMSIESSAELLQCIGKTCRFTTVPAQAELDLGKQAAQ